MLHGKKGFERIVWAFKNVLNHPVAWLFCDLTSESDSLTKGGVYPLHGDKEIQRASNMENG